MQHGNYAQLRAVLLHYNLWSTRASSRIWRPVTTVGFHEGFPKAIRRRAGLATPCPRAASRSVGDHFRLVFVPPITTGVYRRRDKNRHSWFLSWTLYKYLPSRTLPVYGDNQPLTKVTVYGILLPPSIPSLFLSFFFSLFLALSLSSPAFFLSSLPYDFLPTCLPPFSLSPCQPPIRRCSSPFSSERPRFTRVPS